MLKRTRRIELRFRNADDRAEGDVGDQHYRLEGVLDVSRDDTGLMLDVNSLPQRIRTPKRHRPTREEG